MRVVLIGVLAVVLVCSGCGRGKGSAGAPPPARTGGLIVTPANALSGRVVSVNTSARFVVISFPVGRLPLLEQRMAVYHGSLKSGEIKITGPQRDDKIVADILAGEAAVGDEVRPE